MQTMWLTHLLTAQFEAAIRERELERKVRTGIFSVRRETSRVVRPLPATFELKRPATAPADEFRTAA